MYQQTKYQIRKFERPAGDHKIRDFRHLQRMSNNSNPFEGLDEIPPILVDPESIFNRNADPELNRQKILETKREVLKLFEYPRQTLKKVSKELDLIKRKVSERLLQMTQPTQDKRQGFTLKILRLSITNWFKHIQMTINETDWNLWCKNANVGKSELYYLTTTTLEGNNAQYGERQITNPETNADFITLAIVGTGWDHKIQDTPTPTFPTTSPKQSKHLSKTTTQNKRKRQDSTSSESSERTTNSNNSTKSDIDEQKQRQLEEIIKNKQKLEKEILLQQQQLKEKQQEQLEKKIQQEKQNENKLKDKQTQIAEALAAIDKQAQIEEQQRKEKQKQLELLHINLNEHTESRINLHNLEKTHSANETITQIISPTLQTCQMVIKATETNQQNLLFEQLRNDNTTPETQNEKKTKLQKQKYIQDHINTCINTLGYHSKNTN